MDIGPEVSALIIVGLVCFVIGFFFGKWWESESHKVEVSKKEAKNEELAKSIVEEVNGLIGEIGEVRLE